MNIIELYIDGKLCDTSKDFGVRLNRQLLNPAELNAKDAQYSYSVNLPPTAANNAAFGYSIIEETKDKFNRLYTAELYVNSVQIFKGNFKLSEISDKRYKGNLYIPAAKSIKDIFGDIKLADNPEYRIEFKDFAEYISKYNKAAANGSQMAIFPYALYGVLPKVPKNTKDEYSDRNVWDNTVRMGIQDLAPSINPLLMLKHIFDGRKRNSDGSYIGDKHIYKLSGTAFDDERLTNLYMSYKNETNYEQPWNWGLLGQISVSGSWTNINNNNKGVSVDHLETQIYQNTGDRECVAVDMTSAKNAVIDILEDPGANIKQSKTKKEDGNIIYHTDITIPAAGFYKVVFSAKTKVISSSSNGGSSNKLDGLRFAYANSHKTHNLFDNCRYEVKLLKSNAGSDAVMTNSVIDGVYFKDNQNQESNRSGATDPVTGFPIFNTYPKFFPQAKTDSILFVDPAQNPNFVCGFRWGKSDELENSSNPVDESGFNCSLMAAKSGLSWDVSTEGNNLCCVDSPEYWKFGVSDPLDENVGDEDDDEAEKKVIGYELNKRFKINLNSPKNNISRISNSEGEGIIHVVYWFEKNDRLTIADVCDVGVWRQGSGHSAGDAYIKHETSFNLQIEPFQVNKDWLKVDMKGTGTDPMNWNDPITFDTDTIDLVKFLPSDVKTDDFIENFCKAFNLKLTQTALDAFRLDVKQTKAAVSPLFINLDELASVKDRSNSPLGLPSIYKIGFTVNQEEEGYTTTKDDGGGSIETGAVEENIVEQKSNFSYNWFKNINYTLGGANIVLPIPIISKSEVWVNTMAYPDAMSKRYTNLATRFWYYDGLLSDLGADFQFNNNNVGIAKVSNSLGKLITLNYKDEVNTILSTYFTVLVNSSSHYTILEGYVSPEQYERLDGAIMAMFNGDQYYIAEISGYDPLGRNKTKIKLIRKI